MKRLRLVTIFVLTIAASTTGQLRAENEGQQALLEAIDKKQNAENLQDIEEVIKLCRSALDQGLDASNTQFANRVLSATLFQRAAALAGEILEQSPPNPQWPQLRRMAVRDLEEAAQLSPDEEPVHRLLGRLQALPGGDRLRGMQALDTSLRLLGQDTRTKSEVLVIRASMQETPERRLDDINEAIKLTPDFAPAYRLRGALLTAQQKFDDALKDFDKAIELEPDDAETHNARGVALLAAGRKEESIQAFDRAAELAPESIVPYFSKSRAFIELEKWDDAIAALDKALEVQPDNVTLKVQRARVHYLADHNEQALADVEAALQAEPGLPDALALRAQLRAESGRFDLAVQDLERLRAAAPNNTTILLQLAHFQRLDNKFREAIRLFTEVIQADPNNAIALQSRADAYLGIGKHQEAIADYEKALEISPHDDGVLNNLAWVLATSTIDSVRDGKRALELAKQACEVTDYKRPHILSTLAASYAESGDFVEAKKWSEESVRLEKERLEKHEDPERENILEQLQKELASYESGQPWREMQNLEAAPDAEQGEPKEGESEKGIGEPTKQDAPESTPESDSIQAVEPT